MRPHHLLLPLALAAPSALVPASATALPGDPAIAEVLFREGRALATSGDYARACGKFAESERIDPATGTLFNLADCEERLGRTASAWGHFVAAAETMSRSDERYGYATQHAAALEPTLPRLAIVVTREAPASTIVTRDGVPVGEASLGVALPVDPGRHAIVASAPRRESRAVEVELEPRTTRRVEVAPGNPISDALDTRRSVGLFAAGVGVAGLAVGTYLGARALSNPADCLAEACRDAAGLSFATGLAGAVTGSVMILTSRAQVAPSIGRYGGGLTMRVAW